MTTAKAAWCAGKQGRYAQFRTAVLDGKASTGSIDLMRVGKSAGLKLEAFQQCTQSSTAESRVLEDHREAQENGLHGSPVFAVNGVRLSGVQPPARMRQLVQIELRGSPSG
jgi:protein-disulfide isomerase